MALVAYCFTKDVGANKEGDVVQMEQEEAQPLIDAGLLAEATPEDINPGADEAPDEEAPEEQAAITRSIKDGFKELKTALIKNVAKSNTQKPTLGNYATPKTPVFKSQGDIMRAMYFARCKGSQKHYNMLAAWENEVRKKTSPLGANETNTAQGGYTVLPEFTDSVWDKARDYPRLYDKVTKYPVSGNTLYINQILETSLADGFRHGGVRGYWVAEGDTLTSSYPATGRVGHTLKKNAIIAYITSELLEDISYPLDQYLQREVANEFIWQENLAVINGGGTSDPLGILNQAALITVTKSSHSGSLTIGFDDLSAMWKRLWAPSRANAVWLVNPECYNTLLQMQFPNAAATTNIPAFGAFTYSAHDEFPMRIFGKPVIEVLQLPQLGMVGDILLVDLSQLTAGEKPGMRVDTSDQIQFVTDQVAFRFIRRYDIRSPWTAAVTSYSNSSLTYSPFIALQTRGT